jgi:hypothetical protein
MVIMGRQMIEYREDLWQLPRELAGSFPKRTKRWKALED